MSLRDPKIQRLLLTVVLCGLTLWTYFLSDLLPFGYMRRAQQERELRATHETAAAELEKARRSVSSLPQLEREQQELERKWRQAETLLPSDKEVAQLLTQVTQAGEQSGVVFELFKPGAARPQEFYNENPVEIRVRGGYHQVGMFLARMANLPRIVNVSELSLDAGDAGGRSRRGSKDKVAKTVRTDPTVAASFLATAYSLRDVTAAPPAGAPAERPSLGRGGIAQGTVAKARAHATQKPPGEEGVQ